MTMPDFSIHAKWFRCKSRFSCRFLLLSPLPHRGLRLAGALLALARLFGVCHHQGMETYSIETDGAGGYRVEVTRPDVDAAYVAGAFPTWGNAQEWTNERLRVQRRSIALKGLT
jgi:hypothetical protein